MRREDKSKSKVICWAGEEQVVLDGVCHIQYFFSLALSHALSISPCVLSKTKDKTSLLPSV